MDKKAYLDQIAVKGKSKSAPIFTPMLIKLVAAGVVALIAIISIGIVISNANSKVTQSFERVYLRINTLSNNNYNNPFRNYTNKIRNSDLRSATDTFFSVITTSDSQLKGVISSVGVNTGSISKEVQDAENRNISNLSGQLLEAGYAGNIDRVLATNISYQISTLIQYEAEALKKSSNQNFTTILQQSTADLLQLQEQFQNWLDTH